MLVPPIFMSHSSCMILVVFKNGLYPDHLADQDLHFLKGICKDPSIKVNNTGSPNPSDMVTDCNI